MISFVTSLAIGYRTYFAMISQAKSLLLWLWCVQKFQKIDQTDLVPFVYEGKEEIHSMCNVKSL